MQPKCILCKEIAVAGENVCDKHLARRMKVQEKSQSIGHCICTPAIDLGGKPCPCESYKKWNVCHCAGEDKGNVPEGYVWC